MRTTLTLDDDLLRQAKELAARAGRTVSQIIEDAVRESFHRRATRSTRRTRLPTAAGRPRPGIDLDSSAALLDVMEHRQ